MRIIIHVNAHYDFEPVPDGVAPTQADINGGRVKQNAAGKWLMRVKKFRPTHTEVMMPETQVIAQMVMDLLRNKVVVTRSEAVGRYLSSVMVEHAHPKWMHDVEVHDDGPDEALFSGYVAAHVACGNISKDDLVDLKEGYMTADDHVKCLKAHFKIKDTLPETQEVVS